MGCSTSAPREPMHARAAKPDWKQAWVDALSLSYIERLALPCQHCFLKGCLHGEETSSARLTRYELASKRLKREAQWNDKIQTAHNSNLLHFTSGPPLIPVQLQLWPGGLGSPAACVLVQPFAPELRMGAYSRPIEVFTAFSGCVAGIAAIHAAGYAHMDLKPAHARLSHCCPAHVQWVDAELARCIPPTRVTNSLNLSVSSLFDDHALCALPLDTRRLPTAGAGFYGRVHRSTDDCCYTSYATHVLSDALQSVRLRKEKAAHFAAQPRLAAACELQVGTAAYLPPESSKVTLVIPASTPVGRTKASSLDWHPFCCTHPWQARDAFALGMCFEAWLDELPPKLVRCMPILRCIQRALMHKLWFCRLAPRTVALILRAAARDAV